METLKAIARRKTTRAFAPEKQISKEQLDTILAAGCAAPVGASDFSSIHLTVIQDPAILAKINKVVQETMKIDRNFLYNSPTLVITSVSKKQKFPNIQYSNAACIIENMILAATDAEIDSVYLWTVIGIVGGNAKLCKDLGIPESFTPVSGLGLGYAVEKSTTERKLAIKLSVNYIQ